MEGPEEGEQKALGRRDRLSHLEGLEAWDQVGRGNGHEVVEWMWWYLDFEGESQVRAGSELKLLDRRVLRVM